MTDTKNNLLIIEDDLFLSTLIKNRFQKENINVTTAKDIPEALGFIKSSKPDLILLDVILPGSSGFDFLKKIRDDKSLKNLRVVIMSNLGQESDIEEAKELGAIEYFIKSRVPVEELINKTIKLLRS